MGVLINCFFVILFRISFLSDLETLFCFIKKKSSNQGFQRTKRSAKKCENLRSHFATFFAKRFFLFAGNPISNVVQPILVIIKHNIKIHSEIRCFLTRIAHICTLVAIEHLKSSHKSSSYELNFKRIGCKNVLMTIELQIKDIAPRDMQF